MPDAPPRASIRTPLLAVLLLPALLAGLGAWQAWRGAGTRAAYETALATASAQAEALETLAAREPGAMVRLKYPPISIRAADLAERAGRERDSLASDLTVARLRQPVAWLACAAGLAALASGAGALLLAGWAAARGMRSRPALVEAFGRVRRLLPLALAVQVSGLALALLAGVAFEVGGLWFLPRADSGIAKLAGAGIVIAGLAVWGAITALRALRRALALFEPDPDLLLALPVSEAEAPGLFAMLREIVRTQGAVMPDVVTAGAVQGFFVTAFPQRVPGEGGGPGAVVRGRTLHLSLPLAATLDREELRTVLAHELAHFSGEDTAYSMRFQPLYAGLERSAQAMAERAGSWGATRLDRMLERIAHPQTALAIHVLERFHLVVRHWSRLRELEADRAAVASGSAAALASSLLRTGSVGRLLDEGLDRIARGEDAPADLAADLRERSGVEGFGDPRAHLGDRTPHPTDTHPTAAQRIEAVGVPIDECLIARAARPVSDEEFAGVRGLFADWDSLSRRATEVASRFAEDRRQAWQAHLREVAEAAGPEPTELYESWWRPVLGIAMIGVACLAAGGACLVVLLQAELPARESRAVLQGTLGVCAVGLGFVAYWSWRVFRGRGMPYLVLTREGILSPGFVGLVPWLSMRSIDLVMDRAAITSFYLSQEVALPKRTGRIRRLRLRPKEHAVQFMGIRPRGMEVEEFRQLLSRYAQAAHARAELAEQEAGAAPPG